MSEQAIGSRIAIKSAVAAPDIEDCTSLVVETSRGVRLTLDDEDSAGEYNVYELFEADQAWRIAHDEDGNPVTITLSPDYGTPLPSHLFGVGWLKFVGPAATVIAKVFG